MGISQNRACGTESVQAIIFDKEDSRLGDTGILPFNINSISKSDNRVHTYTVD